MNKMIYLVEDDESLAEALSILLSEEGYDVETFIDGNSLGTHMERAIPHMVILDYRLPGENGITITTKLKQQSSTKDLPIMLISATQADLKYLAKKAHADAYLIKPFAINDFLRVVKRLMA